MLLRGTEDEQEVTLKGKWFFSRKICEGCFNLDLSAKELGIVIWFYSLQDFLLLDFTEEEKRWISEDLVPLLRYMEDDYHVPLVISKMTLRGVPFVTEKWTTEDKITLENNEWLKKFLQWRGQPLDLCATDKGVWYETATCLLRWEKHATIPRLVNSFHREIAGELASFILSEGGTVVSWETKLDLDVDGTGTLILHFLPHPDLRERFSHVGKVEFVLY